MIYCVDFGEIVTYLATIGFRQIGTTEHQVIFRSRTNELLIIREPNDNGHLPEYLVNDAFDAARVAVPRWNVFWCD